jgi:ankyrin repeat protein
MIEKAGADSFAVGTDGNTMLHLATKNGFVKVIQYLVETCRVNVDAANANGNTTVHYATDLEAVQYLVIRCVANILAANAAGRTTLHFACNTGIIELVLCMVNLLPSPLV